MKRTVFISIVGRPNVGKSTLLNAILGQKIAIVSDKPQTTRNRIAGIETRGEDQFVFLDTPGIFKPRNELGDYMVKTATNTLSEGDVVILVADVNKPISEVEQNVINIVKSRKTPCILVLNKIDLTTREPIAEAIAKYASLYNFDAVVPISAMKGKYVEDVISECSKFLKEGEWFYEEDDITDQPERQMVAEIIREKILRTIDKEVPHGVAIAIEDFKVDENTGFVSIRAEIFCEKNSHKGILVGKNGETLKRIGTYAREEIEKLVDAKCFLDLWVKVKENWRDSKREVVSFGYDNK